MTLIQVDQPYPHWLYERRDLGTYLRVVPERGGLITEWFSNGRNILYFDQERFLDQNQSVRGGIPILFPICGDLQGGLLKLDNGMFPIKQHGFARDLSWQLKLLDDQTGMSLMFCDNDFTRSIYPYHFSISMEVRLGMNNLDISVSIKNKGKDQMPFSFGLHPYFKVKDLNQIHLTGLPEKCFNHKTMLEAKTNDLITKLHEGIDLLLRPEVPVHLCDSGEENFLRLDYQHPMDSIVLWTDPPRSMICIEPWTGPRNSLVTGERVIILQGGHSQELKCSLICG